MKAFNRLADWYNEELQVGEETAVTVIAELLEKLI